MSWIDVITSVPLTFPAILLGGATAAWAIWNVRDLPVRTLRSTPRRLPDRDPISRMYYGYRAGRVSAVIEQAIERIDRASQRRFGRPVLRLPRTSWGARRLAPEHVALVRRLRRLAGQLDGLRLVALRREAGIWIRLDFWRSRATLRARFHADLLPRLLDVARIPARWTAP